jgi:DNA-binding MarR family transcriptional regulator
MWEPGNDYCVHMATPAPEPDLGELLMRSTRGLRHGWAHALEPWDLTPHHARALQVVGELGNPRLGTVAERLRIAPRSATEVIDALEERALVQRAPDESDRRAICVALTSRGRDVLAEVNEARSTAATKHFSTLTSAERAALAELLAKLDRRRAGRGHEADAESNRRGHS